jgi:hypothetical protein
MLKMSIISEMFENDVASRFSEESITENGHE